jgi:hypothetical protein
MPDPLSQEPKSFIAGDTVTWLKSLSDYSAADGWVLTYEFRGANRQTVTCSADGTDHLATIPAASTASFIPGDYYVFAYAAKGAERYSVFQGTITVKPNPAVGNNPYDGRSHAKRCLSAIEATLEGNASREESSYTIAFGGVNRQLSLCSKDELIRMRNYYLSEVRREEQAEGFSQGKTRRNRILVRFEQ